jgi:hypothetical protein
MPPFDIQSGIQYGNVRGGEVSRKSKYAIAALQKDCVLQKFASQAKDRTTNDSQTFHPCKPAANTRTAAKYTDTKRLHC